MTGLLIAVMVALGSRVVFSRRASWSAGLRAPPAEIPFPARRLEKAMRQAA